jgi:hypothetical protein
VRSRRGGWSSVDEVPPSALIEVGCVGAVFDHFAVRLLPESSAGRDCSGKELTADAMIAQLGATNSWDTCARYADGAMSTDAAVNSAAADMPAVSGDGMAGACARDEGTAG